MKRRQVVSYGLTRRRNRKPRTLYSENADFISRARRDGRLTFYFGAGAFDMYALNSNFLPKTRRLSECGGQNKGAEIISAPVVF